MAGYYYRQLDREKRGVYDAMLAGMEALAPGIRVPRLDGPELSDIYLRLKLDTPLLFYVTGFQSRWMPGADHVELLPEYLFAKGTIRQHRQAVVQRYDHVAHGLDEGRLAGTRNARDADAHRPPGVGQASLDDLLRLIVVLGLVALD